MAGGTPIEFNTVSISDGITMGTEGMRASLVSREVIADSIELVARGNGFDAVVVLVGCDKTIPGGVMALARLNVPGVVLYGGSIAAGHFEGHEVTIQDVFEAVGANAAGRMSDARLCELEDSACPGAGACGGQFTANTMALAVEFLGIVSPSGAAACRRPTRARPAWRAQIGALAVQLCRVGREAARHHHAGRARERDRLGGGDRRVDQRGAAPAGDRARSRRGPHARRFQPRGRSRPAARGPQAVGPLRRRGDVRGGRQPAVRASARGGRLAPAGRRR